MSGPRVEVARRQIIREEAVLTITLDEETAIDLVALVAAGLRLVGPLKRPFERECFARIDRLGEAVMSGLTHAGVTVPDPEKRFEGTPLARLSAQDMAPALVRVPVAHASEDGTAEPRAGLVPKFV